jgi:hypothetical protein
MPVIEGRSNWRKPKALCATRKSMRKAKSSNKPGAKIGTLYVRKSAFERGSGFPQFLRVTVETASP